MTNYRSLNHTRWAFQCHVVFIPEYRKKAIYGGLRRYLPGRGVPTLWLSNGKARWKKAICWRITST